MIVKFLKKYPHTIKTFPKDAVVRLMPDFAKELIKKKIAIEVSKEEFEEDKILKNLMEDRDG